MADNPVMMAQKEESELGLPGTSDKRNHNVKSTLTKSKWPGTSTAAYQIASANDKASDCSIPRASSCVESSSTEYINTPNKKSSHRRKVVWVAIGVFVILAVIAAIVIGVTYYTSPSPKEVNTVQIVGDIVIMEAWSDHLADNNTKEYKTKKVALETELENIFKKGNLGKIYQYVEVISFRPGSVIVSIVVGINVVPGGTTFENGTVTVVVEDDASVVDVTALLKDSLSGAVHLNIDTSRLNLKVLVAFKTTTSSLAATSTVRLPDTNSTGSSTISPTRRPTDGTTLTTIGSTLQNKSLPTTDRPLTRLDTTGNSKTTTQWPLTSSLSQTSITGSTDVCPCLNGGVCMYSLGTRQNRCFCSFLYTGRFCQYQIATSPRPWTTVVPGFSCRYNAYQCVSGSCIPHDWVCDDRYDCKDGSDESPFLCEQNYTMPATTTTQMWSTTTSRSPWRSTTSRITRDWQTTPPTTVPWWARTTTGSTPPWWTTPWGNWTTTPSVCPPGTFRCGDDRCLSMRIRCDGTIDCRGGEDERGCVQLFASRTSVNVNGEIRSLCVGSSEYGNKKLGENICLYLGHATLESVSVVTGTEVPHGVVFYSTPDAHGFLNNFVPIIATNCVPLIVQCVELALDCGVPSVPLATNYIQYGSNAVAGQWPWQILLKEDGQFVCGGSLINDRWVTTATHCVDGYLDSNYTVTLGSLRRNRREDGEIELSVSGIIQHPNFIERSLLLDNDITLLLLNDTVNFTDHIRPVCLPREPLSGREICYTTGWGDDEIGINPFILQQIRVTTYPSTPCKVINPTQTIKESMVCAIKASRYSPVCYGDSGGPLVCLNKAGRWDLHGVTSFGPPGCRRTEATGVAVFANVFHYKTWLEETMVCRFTCDNGHCLYEKDRVCDGKPDCTDGSDEDKSLCGNSISCGFELNNICGYSRQPTGTYSPWEQTDDFRQNNNDSTNTGRYMVVGFASLSPNATFSASLRSPIINATTTQTCLRFYFQLWRMSSLLNFGDNNGPSLQVRSIDTNGNSHPQWTMNGLLNRGWNLAAVTLPGGIVGVEFLGRYPAFIDDVEHVENGSCPTIECIRDTDVACDNPGFCMDSSLMCDSNKQCMDPSSLDEDYDNCGASVNCTFDDLVYNCGYVSTTSFGYTWTNSMPRRNEYGLSEGSSFGVLWDSRIQVFGAPVTVDLLAPKFETVILESCLEFYFSIRMKDSRNDSVVPTFSLLNISSKADSQLWSRAGDFGYRWYLAQVNIPRGSHSLMFRVWLNSSDDVRLNRNARVALASMDDVRVIPGMCDTSVITCSAEDFSCGPGYCIPIAMFCDGIPNCPDGSDEVDGCIPDGQIRLVGGEPGGLQGRVEIYHAGMWGSVCTLYTWGESEADVVCASLGGTRGGGNVGLRGPFFGASSRPMWIALRCLGHEDKLIDCVKQSNWGQARCSSSNYAVAVVCGGAARLANVVRLQSFDKPWIGYVQIFQGEWRTICNAGWNNNAADITCKMLGFRGSAGAVGTASLGVDVTDVTAFPGPMFGGFNCSGNERFLHNCDHSGQASTFCNFSEFAAVECLKDEGELAPNPDRFRLYGAADSPRRLEVLYNNQWGTVCNDGMTQNTLSAICRYFGYSNGTLLPNASPGTGPIWLDDLVCNYERMHLPDCTYTLRHHDCNHYQDLVVNCFTVCGQGETLCSNNISCINTEYVCDGYLDCPGGDDELSCEAECDSESEHLCPGGQCISSGGVCDGIADCVDGSDELGCVRVNSDSSVEIQNLGQWRPLCVTKINAKEVADVICRLISYGTASRYLTRKLPGLGWEVTPSSSNLTTYRGLNVTSGSQCENLLVTCKTTDCGIFVSHTPGLPGLGQYLLGDWPGYVRLWTRDWLSSMCDGIMVNSNWVLVNIYCVRRLLFSDGILPPLKAGRGGWSLREPEWQSVITAIKINTNITETDQLGLLKLAHTVDISPVCLPISDDPLPLDNCFLVTYPDVNTDYSARGIRVEYCDQLTCSYLKEEYFSLNTSHPAYCIRVIDSKGSPGTCLTRTTAGTPLVCRHPSGRWVVKAMSLGGTCLRQGTIDVVIPLSSQEQWISNATGICTFQCSNGECLHQLDSVCDGTPDCGDASDEGTICGNKAGCNFDYNFNCGYNLGNPEGLHWAKVWEMPVTLAGTFPEPREGRYLKATGGTGLITPDSNTAVLVSPDLTSDCVIFRFKMHDYFSLELDVVALEATKKTTLLSLRGNYGYSWRKAMVQFNSTLTRPLKLAFYARNFRKADVIALDDIETPEQCVLECEPGDFICDNRVCLEETSVCEHCPGSGETCPEWQNCNFESGLCGLTNLTGETGWLWSNISGPPKGGPWSDHTFKIPADAYAGYRMSIRLVNGLNSTKPSFGRVEMFHDGQWGTICHSNFGDNEARVVCRMLGYGFGTAKCCAYYGEGSGEVWFSTLNCHGTEHDLSQCMTSAWSNRVCSHSEDVGVFCTKSLSNSSSTTVMTGSFIYTTGYNKTLATPWFSNEQPACLEFYYQLFSRSYYRSLFVKDEGTSGKNVVFSETKHGQNWWRLGQISLLPGRHRFVFQNIRTRGVALDDIRITNSPCLTQVSSCDITEYRCQGTSTCVSNSEMCTGLEICPLNDDESSCYTLPDEIRLDAVRSRTWSSISRVTADVKIRHAGKWRPLVFDLFASPQIGPVICRQFGFGFISVWREREIYNDLWNVKAECDGTEESLFSCRNYRTRNQYGPYSTKVGCQRDLDNQFLQLVDGEKPNEGRLEVRLNGKWGTICDDAFGEDEAIAACRTIGFRGRVEILNSTLPGRGPIWLDDFSCDTDNFTECKTENVGVHDCTHYEDVVLRCQHECRFHCQNAGCLYELDAVCDGERNCEDNSDEGSVCDKQVSCNFDYHTNCGYDGGNPQGYHWAKVRWTSGNATIKDHTLGTRDGGYFMAVKGTELGTPESITAVLLSPEVTSSCVLFHFYLHGSLSLELDVVAVEPTKNTTVLSFRGDYSDSWRRGLLRFNSTFTRPLQLAFYARNFTFTDIIAIDDVNASDSCVLECENDDFRCTSSDLCLDPRTVCDTYENCPDGSDEGFCSDWIDCDFEEGICGYENSSVPIFGPGWQWTNGSYLPNGAPLIDHTYKRPKRRLGVHPYLRLVNGDRSATTISGRIEILHDGEWGTLCDDGYGSDDALVVCRMLGYREATPQCCSAFGDGTGRIWLDNVRCSGTELDITDCPHGGWGNLRSCYHWEDAGVECSYPANLNVAESGTDIRLVGGTRTTDLYSGRVEVFHNGERGTICDDSFGLPEATVICNMLGYSKGAAICCAVYGEGSGKIWLDNLDCVGRESDIASCRTQSWGSHDCDHSEDAGVICTDPISNTDRVNDPSGSYIYTIDYSQSLASRLIKNSEEACLEFYYVLFGGYVTDIGGMVVKQQDESGEIDLWEVTGGEGDKWHLVQIGIHPGSHRFVFSNKFDTGVGIDDVRMLSGPCLESVIACDLTEYQCNATSMCIPDMYLCNKTVKCPMGDDQRNCNSSQDEIRLTPAEERTPNALDVRLYHVMMRHSGIWRPIVIRGWLSAAIGQVLCRQFGLTFVSMSNVDAGGYKTTWRVILACDGTEDDVLKCNFGDITSFPSDRDRLQLRCSEDMGDTQSANYLRLEGGQSPNEGRLSIRLNSEWGTVCDDGFSEEEATAACRTMGFRGQAVILNTSLPGTGRIWLDGVSCSSDSFLKCKVSRLGVHDCTHYEDVVLRCDQVCNVGYTLCGDARTCIKEEWICDGDFDCDGGTDEENCNTCTADQFTCTNYQCIPSNQRCDGVPNCDDVSDEFRCLYVTKENHVMVLDESEVWHPLCGINMDSVQDLGTHVCDYLGYSAANSVNLENNEVEGLLASSSNTRRGLFPGYNMAVPSSCKPVVVECKMLECGVQGFEEPGVKTMDGKRARVAEWPWQVLITLGPNPTCTGVLLNENWVLTTSCVSNTLLANLTVRLGVRNWRETGRQEIQRGVIKRIKYRLENFDLLLLDDPVTYTPYIRPVCLPQQFDFTPTECYQTGWGGEPDSRGKTIFKDDLLKAQSRIVSSEKCHGRNIPLPVNGTFPTNTSGAEVNATNLYTEHYICSHSDASRGNGRTCGSSGILVCKNKADRWEVFGIRGENRLGIYPDCSYSLYPSVPNIIEWIDEQTACPISCGDRCIYDESKICDGKNDCPNGEDETTLCAPSVNCTFSYANLCGYQNTSSVATSVWTRRSYDELAGHSTGGYILDIYDTAHGHYLYVYSEYLGLTSASVDTPELSQPRDQVRCLRFRFSAMYYEGNRYVFSVVAVNEKRNTEVLRLDSGLVSYRWKLFSVVIGPGARRIRFISKETSKGFMAIDNVRITDGSCVTSCNGREFLCPTGECVSLSARCDKYKDCVDGSDEEGCGESVNCDFEDSWSCGYKIPRGSVGWWRGSNLQDAPYPYRKPQTDHTYKTTSGYKIWPKVSDNGHAILVSPPFSISEDSCVTFYYNLQNSRFTSITIPSPDVLQVFTYSNFQKRIRWTPRDISVGRWRLGQFPLTPGTYRLIFSGRTVGGKSHLAYLDDTRVVSGRCHETVSSCGTDEFRCNSGECVPERWVCDSIRQCPDSSDEERDCDKPLHPIRLVGGGVATQGRVEILNAGRWGSVCNAIMTLNTIRVICRMSNISLSGARRMYFGSGPPFWLDSLRCSGNERRLSQCLALILEEAGSKWHSGICSSAQTAGVQCSYISDGTDNNVRLVGKNGWEGRVEIYHDRLWGSVCNSGWDLKDAQVVCRMMGYGSEAQLLRASEFEDAPNSTEIWLSNVYCRGDEERLDQCIHPGWGQTRCEHNQDVGIRCLGGPGIGQEKYPRQASERIRLVDGPAPNQGRVEVQYGEIWGTVCDDFVNKTEVDLICQTLGYSRGGLKLDNVLPGTGQIWLDDLDCSDSSSMNATDDPSIFSCGHQSPGVHNCDHLEDLVVECVKGCGDRPQFIGTQLAIAERSQPNQWPWIGRVSISGNDGCTAVLIDSDWAITSPECVKTNSGNSISVTFGTNVRVDPMDAAISRSVEEVRVHPGYSTASSDQFPVAGLALLKLDEPVHVDTTNVGFICVPEMESDIPPMSECYIAGWGTQNKDSVSDKLQHAPIEFVQSTTCGQRWTPSRPVNTTVQLCVEYLQGGNPPCYADEGGPLMCENGNGGWILTGVLSQISSSCLSAGGETTPNVYTKVSHFRDWIDQNLRS